MAGWSNQTVVVMGRLAAVLDVPPAVVAVEVAGALAGWALAVGVAQAAADTPPPAA